MMTSLFSHNLTRVGPKVTCVYGSGRGFSGQRFASELLVSGLRQRGWQVVVVTTPLLDRIGEYSRGKRLREKLGMGLRLVVAWLKGLGIALRPGILYVNLGQTRFALIRDGLPLLVRSLVPYGRRAAVSLNGNVFMGWAYDSLEAKLLRNMARAARYITVVGPSQQQRLVELGIAAEKAVHMDNACLLSPITERQCLEKQTITAATSPLHVLYLSNLVESKGYPEFVEALRRLATCVRFPLEATLCGNITTTMETYKRFATPQVVRNWITEHVAEINQSARVRLRWIDGAADDAKARLFRDAHLFILPSRYKVEAQPIVILEALASGCAVITTQVGEIPATVSHHTALLLDEVSPETIAAAIMELQGNPDARRRLALNGLKLFAERFTYTKHLDQWEQLLFTMHRER